VASNASTTGGAVFLATVPASPHDESPRSAPPPSTN
jgi:hypothetical protein